MTSRAPQADALLLPAGRSDLCLDFANTLCWRGSEHPEESLPDLSALLRWLTGSAHLPPEAADMEAWQPHQSDQGARLFADAIAIREVMFRLFSTVAVGEPPAAADLDALNAALREAPPRHILGHGTAGAAWAARPGAKPAATLLAPVLWSAADLLTRAEEFRVRRCGNDKCLWLFIDRSKAGTRRWCDMAACGNRAKSQRHYARSKAT
jgi:predicted RNA-binding Zn ribbon-like protein